MVKNQVRMIKVWDKPCTYIEVPIDASEELIQSKIEKFKKHQMDDELKFNESIKGTPFERAARAKRYKEEKKKRKQYHSTNVMEVSTVIGGHKIGRF